MDQRCHGTVQEIVAERVVREASTLRPLPAVRYDTAYQELRQVSWDAYMDVRCRRDSDPAHPAGHSVQIRLTLEGELAIYEAVAP